MEKMKMFVFNSGEAEEPVPRTGHLCQLQGLEVRMAMLDDIMASPEAPDRYPRDPSIRVETQQEFSRRAPDRSVSRVLPPRGVHCATLLLVYSIRKGSGCGNMFGRWWWSSRNV